MELNVETHLVSGHPTIQFIVTKLTLPKTNSSHLKIGRNPNPTIHFQVLTVSFGKFFSMFPDFSPGIFLLRCFCCAVASTFSWQRNHAFWAATNFALTTANNWANTPGDSMTSPYRILLLPGSRKQL